MDQNYGHLKHDDRREIFYVHPLKIYFGGPNDVPQLTLDWRINIVGKAFFDSQKIKL